MSTLQPIQPEAQRGRVIPAERKNYLCPWIALLAAVILVLRLAICVNVFSRTIDEPVHLGGAVSTYEAGKAIAGVAHPPLTRWIASIPLYLDGVRLPQCRGITIVQKEDFAYAWGNQVLYNSKKPARTILSHARLAMLVFPVFALLFVYLLTRYLAGSRAAAAAVVFFSVDPALLGHGLWVGTDVAATAGFLASSFYFIRWIDRPTIARAVVLGLAMGLSIAAKFSCVLIVPAIFVILLIRWRSLVLRQVIGHAGIAFGAAFVAIWASYLFNIGTLGAQNVLGHPPEWEHLPSFVRNTPIPMPSFFLGVARQAGHNRSGHLSYLNGKVSLSGWWYYFPEILAIKNTIGFVLALLIALGLWLISPGKLNRTVQATLLPAGLFLLISMKGHIDIGVRHILPALSLLYVFCAIQLSRQKFKPLLGALIILSAVETACVHPDYISFFNVAVGGSAGGQKLAGDSNLDWGQDVYRLADYIQANHVNDYAVRLCGLRSRPLLHSLGLDQNALEKPVHGRLLFVDLSARLLEGRMPWLSQLKPAARIGTTIEMYDLRGTVDSPTQPNDPPPPDVPTVQP